MEPFLGMISMFGFNFAPRGWAYCNGQLMPIAQNSALFSLLGTSYGGNGQTTFGLPDLQGRMPMHFGQGNGLSPRSIGELGGVEATTLNASNMPAHTHAITVSAGLYGETAAANKLNPLGSMLATPAPTNPIYAAPDPTGENDKLMAAASLRVNATASVAGSNSPFATMPPYLAINFCIALEGIYPSRS